MRDEAELIERIRRGIPSAAARGGASSLRIGIGDDAAVLRPAGRSDWVLTCDAFLEGVHFRADVHPADAVGYKALARATSDLAAMGAVPRFFLLTLALPAPRTGRWLNDFIDGMAKAARRFGLVLAGGDTSRNNRVAVSITVLGEVSPGRAIARSGARPRDLIFVSGRLGAAELGLRLVLRGLQGHPVWRRFLRPHLYPDLRLGLGQWLARRELASAMIDTSDGLSTDLGHICDASGVGAKIWKQRIPAVRVPAALRERDAVFDPLALALHGGEDYELVFTVSPRLCRNIPEVWSSSGERVPVTQIGEIVRGREITLLDANGNATPLRPLGWDHFRKR